MSGGCLDGVCGCLTVSGSYLGVSGRCLGEYRCHINHKQLNRSRYTKLLSFLPVTSCSQIGAKWQFHTFDWAWGFFWSQVADFCSKWLVLVHYKGLGGWHCQILIWPIYQYTLLIGFISFSRILLPRNKLAKLGDATPIWNYQSLTDPLTHPLTDRGRC